MAFRVSTHSNFMRFLTGLRGVQLDSARAQEQLSSGRRILKPSDDPTGTARSLLLSRRLANVDRYSNSIASGLGALNSAASAVQQGSSLLAEARTLLLQAMNGTLTSVERGAIATEFDLLREQLLEVANSRVGDRYLFSGTRSEQPAFEKVGSGEGARVVYRGNDDSQLVRIGQGIDVGINVPGSEIFGRLEYSGTSLTGSTGLSAGITADEGLGYETLVLRHDSTDPGALASVGIGLVNGGSDDTLLGSQTLTIDAAAGTIQLGNGPLLKLPQVDDDDLADFTIENEQGGELHLDFSTFSGADFTDTVSGAGSISIDGAAFSALSFTETDLELKNEASGAVIHVDATGVLAAGEELVNFDGAINVFDVMQSIADDLRDGDTLEQDEIVDRLRTRLVEVDRHHENVLLSAGVLGSRSQRLSVSEGRAADLRVQLESSLSRTRDADITEVALDLARSEFSLQLAQSSGARLLQSTLLNFI